MSKKVGQPESSGHTPSIPKKAYKESPHKLQIELVKLRRHFIQCIARTDGKHLARLNIIKDLLSRLHYAGKDKRLIHPGQKIVLTYTAFCLENIQLAP